MQQQKSCEITDITRWPDVSRDVFFSTVNAYWSALVRISARDKFHSVPHSIMHSMADSTWFAGECRGESH